MLSGLALSAGTLSPAFAPDMFAYAASVPNATARITVEPTVNERGAIVAFLDGADAPLDDADGTTDGHQVDLAAGANVVNVAVTSGDRGTTQTYSVTVTRTASTTTMPATGAPTITGEPRVDKTLTAKIGTIADADGLPAVFPDDYDLQWLLVDGGSETPIPGETSVTYTLSSSDVGKTVKVQASFVDGAGDREGPLASDATAAVVPVCADVWCATLTVQSLADGAFGCATSQSGKECASHLTEDEFTYDSTDNTVRGLQVSADGELRLYLSADMTPATQSLVLVVGTERFPFAHSDTQAADRRFWSGSGLIWTSGAAVDLTLVEASSSDAALKSLEIEDGNGDAVALSPSFAAAETDYTASVADAVLGITVTAAARSAKSRLDYLDRDGNALRDADTVAPGHQVGLDSVDTVVRVRVTAEDGTTRTYTATVTRPRATGTVLVTNRNETERDGQFSYVLAQGFTTGSNPGGYRLDSMSIYLADNPHADSNDTHVGVWSSNGVPDELIASLTTPSSIGTGTRTFAAPPRLLLDPDTSYFVVLNRGLVSLNDRLYFKMTSSHSETSEYGWRIANGVRVSADPIPTTWTSAASSLSMRLDGDELPACTVELGDRTGIWSGEVTVGDYRGGLSFPLGFGFSDGDYGALSDVDFDLGASTGVEISSLWVGVDGTLRLDESSALPAADYPALRLHVCGDTFDLAAASVQETHEWPSSGLDWSAVRRVSVALSASPDATLSGLALSAGTLSPAFAPDTFAYAASVLDATARITVEPTVNERGAVVAFLDGADAPLDDADGTTDGHQVDLAVGAKVVKVAVTPGDRGTTQTYSVTVTRGATNSAPTFDDGTSTTRAVAENTGPNQNVGAAVSASDAENDTLRYTLEGADVGSFGIDSGSGQLRTSAALDHESKSSYAVRVKADDNKGGTATIDVTVNVTDVDEQPARPATPTVAATANTTDSVDVGWAKPALNGGPEIVGYLLQHRVAVTGAWIGTTPPGTGTMATIDGLAEDTLYEVQVKALNGETPSDWSIAGEGRTGSGTNSAPTFDDGASTTRAVAENTGPNQSVGAAVSADDADDDTLTYDLEGTDAASFGIDTGSGQLHTSAALDHESKSTYAVTVTVEDDDDTATIAVTVNVTDVAEKPAKPATPTVTTTANTTDSVDVSWTKPGLDGGPDIVGYKLQYEVSGSGSWTETTPSGTGTTATIGTLAEDTEYAVQVRALNGETPSDWSASGTGRTGAGSNTAPEFADGTSTTREVAENTPSGQLFGDAVSADDPDGDSLKYTLEGADAASFRIGRTTGRLRTSAALDHEAKPSHTLTVKADDERGGTDTIDVTVNVTDVDEPPSAPGAPTVSAVEGSATSLSVRWSAPANTGPRVTDYDLRHKKTGGSWTDGPENVTGRSATIGGLARDTEYEVQVLARNDEGESGWSPSGRRTTGQAARSVHMEDVTVHEGETARFTIVFSPARSDDRLLWSTHDNQARAGEDFPRTNNRSTALQAGATEVTGAVEIYADDEAEDEERFQIAITFGDVGDTVEYAGSIYIRDGARSNTAPEFDDGTSTTREVAENTASGQPVGGVVEADDAEDDPLTYTLEGADAASFGIDRTTGQLRTAAALDHEAKASYTLRVKADDDHGGTARIVVTVNVEDVAEKPATPAAPRVSATANSTDSLDVAWRKPGLDGGPDIVGYKLRYEVSGSGSWTETTPSGTGTTATIGTLAEDTEYAVRVRALNGETPSDWSPSGTGRTGAGSNTAPEFADGTSTTREVAENTASGQPVGRVVEADDADDDPLTYTLEGADAASFGIDRTTGQLRTAAALDHEAKASYTLRVKADDDHGGTARIVVTVNVEDVAEKPATPAAPRVSATANSTDSLDVAWRKPGLDGGPDIVGYRLRRGVRDRSGWFETTTRYPATARSAAIDGLAEDTEYDVRVRALNGEDTSDWSPPGFGRTGANAAPVFDDGARTTRSVAENTASGRPVGRPVSADDANDDELTYTLEGPDAGSFGIDRRTGQLRTSADLDHESKASHTLTVKADDGEGGTATIDVTVNATDVDEPPRAPDAPSVAGGATSLSVRWSGPENTGPPVTEYDLRYRKTGGSWTDGPQNVAGRTATIGELAADTEYEVQVLARNDEGESGWSRSGPGITGQAERSVYMEDVAVHEGETARFTIVFSPARSDDRLLWETHDNRARAGEDFPRTGRGIALQAGATEVTGAVEIYADDEAEDEERFQIAITFGDIGDTVEYAGNIYINDGARPASANPSARVVGDLLTLRYADALDAGSTPGPKDWVVRAATATGSRTLAVTGVSVLGAEVALRLSPPAVAGESVAVSYLRWAMHPLLGPEGAEAAPLTEQPVRNETPASAPVEPPPVPVDPAAGLADGPTAGTPAPFGPWLSALLAERRAASLTRLDLPDRGLTDVSALAGLTGLEVLDLHGNALADVWPLAGLVNLRRLDLSANRIEDVSALAGLAELEVLLLDGNRIEEVLPLALLPRLARLDLSDNRVADAALLAELRSLTRLDLSGNRIADVSPLGDLSRLVWLDLTGNPVSDAAPARPTDGAALAVAGRGRAGALGAGAARGARGARAHRDGRAGGDGGAALIRGESPGPGMGGVGLRSRDVHGAPAGRLRPGAGVRRGRRRVRGPGRTG